jgi:glycosyltransferase involved in cell wall biosynthesis
MVNKYALGALAVGRFAADDFVRWGIKREKIGLLFYSPETEVPSVDAKNKGTWHDIAKSRRVFLYVGRLDKGKGIDLLLKAYREAIKHDEQKAWVLVLVGNDLSYGRYANLAKKLGIENRTVFAGVVPAEKILTVHAIANVLILPSRFDGWGVVVNESCSQGKALIVSDHCGAAQLVEPGINGFIFKSGDWLSLAHMMGIYISNPELALRHGKISLKIYEKYTPEANAERFCQIINTWMT